MEDVIDMDSIGGRVTQIPDEMMERIQMIPAPPPRSEILTRPVLIGAGVGYLARGVTGAIIGAILGSLWRR